MEEINFLKKCLDEAIESSGLDSEEVLELSQKLDKLIAEFYKEKNEDNKDR